MLCALMHEERQGTAGPGNRNVQKIALLGIIHPMSSSKEVLLVQYHVVVLCAFRTVDG